MNMKTRYGMYGLSGISGLGFAPEEHLKRAMKKLHKVDEALEAFETEKYDCKSAFNEYEGAVQLRGELAAERKALKGVQSEADREDARELQVAVEELDNQLHEASQFLQKRCLRPKPADEGASDAPWYKRMFNRGVSGFGSERTPGQEKYNEPNMEYRRTREEHDSVEELEAEADELLFQADSILDEHRGASSLCDSVLLNIREAARIVGNAEAEAGFASRVALDEHLKSTTEKFIKKCVRKPRG